MARPTTPEGFPEAFGEGSHGEHLVPLFRRLWKHVPQELWEKWQEETCLIEDADRKLRLQMNGHPPTWGPAVSASVARLRKHLGKRSDAPHIDLRIIKMLGSRQHVRLFDEMRSYPSSRLTLLKTPHGTWHILGPRSH